MKLYVCALADLEQQVLRHRPAGVISLLAPEQTAPAIPSEAERLALYFHDIDAPRDGLVAPDADTVAEILAFAAEHPPEASLLVHCWMGISRSTATAFILACAAHPPGQEAQIAQTLRQASPTATPNRLLVSLADDQLGRRGRMVAAVAAIGRGEDAAMGQAFELKIGTGEAAK